MVNAGRFPELEAKARALLEHRPDSGLAWKALSVALTVLGKDALDALARAAALLPDDAEAHGNLGNALLRAGRLDQALASYTRALELKPDYAEVCNNRGNALRGLGRPHEAIASYSKALELKADFAEAYSNMGNALRGLGRLDEAVTSYSKALAVRPDYPEACNNLGNALFDLAQFDAAAARYRQALERRPGFIEAHSNLGNALRRLGRFEAAVESYRRALTLDPGFASAHSNLGDVLRDLGQVGEAAASCRRAIAIQPDLAGAHNSLGNALLDAGELEAAAASYRQALALRRDFAEAYINLGLVQRQLGFTAEAENSCRTALQLQPNAVAALVLQAELQTDGGRFTAAEALFARAAAQDPNLPEAWAGIAHLRKMTLKDAAWAAQAQRMAERQPPRQEIHLRFALGKYFDDVQDFERAFTHYRRAHELMGRYAARYDAERQTRAVDRTIELYGSLRADQEPLAPRAALAARAAQDARAALDAEASARPVFIVGMPRSGTTLAEQILASHPAVFGAGELPFWTSGAARHQSRVDGGAAADAGSTRQLARDYLRLLAELSPDALRVVDKMPGNFACLGLIHEALPNARIIHMHRNPLDTCLSIFCQHFKAGHAYAHDLDDLAHYYREYLRLMSHWRATLPGDALLEVPYEGLIDDQETWSRAMLRFIGVPWDALCMNFHETDRSVMTASKWQVRQKLHRSSIGRWRNYQEYLGPLLALASAQPAAAS